MRSLFQDGEMTSIAPERAGIDAVNRRFSRNRFVEKQSLAKTMRRSYAPRSRRVGRVGGLQTQESHWRWFGL